MSSIPTTSPRISISPLAPALGQEVTTGSQEIKAGASQIKTSSAQVGSAGTDSFERAADHGKNAGNETLAGLGSVYQGGKEVGQEARAQADQVADGASQIAQGAKDEAKKTLPDIVRDEMPDGDRRDFVIIVRNGAGEGIFQVTLTLAVEPLP